MLLLHKVFAKYESVITIEDGVVKGGFGSAVLEFAAAHHYHVKIRCLGVPDEFIEQGKIILSNTFNAIVRRN